MISRPWRQRGRLKSVLRQDDLLQFCDELATQRSTERQCHGWPYKLRLCVWVWMVFDVPMIKRPSENGFSDGLLL